MPTLSNTIVSSSLVLLSAVGVYTTWYLLMSNGTVDHMKSLGDVGPRMLPGTREPVKTSYAGIEAIDYQLGVLTIFFWEMIDGSRPSASLFSFYFGGQLAVGWSLFLLEGVRNGNRWRVISYMTIWGLAVQKVSFAVTMPLYMAVHLSTSPTIASHKPSDFICDVSELCSIPISMLIGYVVPAILLALPAPSVFDFDSKQGLMATWQAFPIWVGLLQQILPSVLSRFGVSSGSPNHTESVSLQWISTARKFYSSIFAFAVAIHISTFALIASSHAFPTLYRPERPFDLSTVFMPASVSASTKMTSIGSGALQLLQYDFFVGSAASVIWASSLTLKKNHDGDSLSRWITQSFWFIVLTALTGPFGYVVACIWARDEDALVEVTQVDKDR